MAKVEGKKKKVIGPLKYEALNLKYKWLIPLYIGTNY